MNERIKELRKALGLSREEFANKLGLKSRGKIENIELGRNKEAKETQNIKDNIDTHHNEE